MLLPPEQGWAGRECPWVGVSRVLPTHCRDSLSASIYREGWTWPGHVARRCQSWSLFKAAQWPPPLSGEAQAGEWW